MAKNEDYFIQGSIKRPGRTHRYIMRCYGKKAFTIWGTIKPKYLNMAIKRAKKEGETSLERALLEAKTLKRLAKRKESKQMRY